MARYKPVDPHLTKLLPVSLEAQIQPGTFEYAVNWMVDHEIDLSPFDARYRNDETGAPAYHPGVLLKVILLGYSRGLTSSRQIADACCENILFMALSNDSAPHFTTIAGFIRHMPAEILPVFRDVLLVCDQEGLIGRELFAVDGCKLPSNASRTWSGTREDLARKAQKMEDALAQIMARHRKEDESPDPPPDRRKRERQQIETLKKRSQKLREALATLEPRTNAAGKELKTNLTDPDSATMKSSHGTIQGYTGVATVDAAHQIVVDAQAFGTGSENALLPQAVEGARAHFAAIGISEPFESATFTADSGYHSEAALEALAHAKINALVADNGMRQRDPAFNNAWQHKPKDRQRPDGKKRSKWFQRDDFQFDPVALTCICPAGESLKCKAALVTIKGCTGPAFAGTVEQCTGCPLRVQCLRKPDVSPYRQVSFLNRTTVTHPRTAEMKARIDTPEGRSRYARRMATVEPVFGNLHNHRLRRFTLRGKDKVNAQWNLFCIVHNLQKLQPLIERRQAQQSARKRRA